MPSSTLPHAVASAGISISREAISVRMRGRGRGVVGMGRSVERLSSGLRITRAADDAAGLADLRGRMQQYLEKALREAKERTRWTDVNTDYEAAVRDFIAPFFERIDRGFEWVNVPPATLFWAYKDKSEG